MQKKIFLSLACMGLVSALLPARAARCDIIGEGAALSDVPFEGGSTSVLSSFLDNTPRAAQIALNGQALAINTHQDSNFSFGRAVQSLLINPHQDGNFNFSNRLFRANPFSFAVSATPDYSPNFGFGFANNISGLTNNFVAGTAPSLIFSG